MKTPPRFVRTACASCGGEMFVREKDEGKDAVCLDCRHRAYVALMDRIHCQREGETVWRGWGSGKVMD